MYDGNLAQLDIRAAFENDYVVQAPLVPPRIKKLAKQLQNAPRNEIVYHQKPLNLQKSPIEIYDLLVSNFERHLRRPETSFRYKHYNPEKIKDLKIALETNTITENHISYLNQYSAFKTQQTFLYSLLEIKQYKLIEFLLQLTGINVNKGTYQGRTPLMLACAKQCHLHILPSLLAHPHIDVNRLCKPRQPSELSAFHAAKTALHTAVHCENEKAVEALLNHPAIDISITDSYGKTAYMYAVEKAIAAKEQYEKIVALFEAKGVQPYTPRSIETPNFAAVHSNLSRISRVQEVIGDPNAMIEDDVSLVSFLQDHGESINDVSDLAMPYPAHLYSFPKCLNRLETCEGTALVSAILKLNLTATMALLAHPAIDVQKPVLMNAWNYFSEYNFDIPNVTFPLMCATQDLAFTKLLLNHPGTDVNQKNVLGETALMRACESQNVGVVKELLKSPAIDLNCRNVHGKSALIFGIEDAAIVRMLLMDDRLDASQTGQACLTCATSAPLPSLELLLQGFKRTEKGTKRGTKRLIGQMVKRVYTKGEGKDAVTRIKWLHSTGASISNNDSIRLLNNPPVRFVDHIFQKACVNGDIEMVLHFLEEPFFSRYKVDISEKTLYNWEKLGQARINELWRRAGCVRKPGFNSLMEKVMFKNNSKPIVIALSFGTPHYEKLLRFLELKEEIEEGEAEAEQDWMDAAQPRVRPARLQIDEEEEPETDENETDNEEENEETEVELRDLMDAVAPRRIDDDAGEEFEDELDYEPRDEGEEDEEDEEEETQ